MACIPYTLKRLDRLSPYFLETTNDNDLRRSQGGLWGLTLHFPLDLEIYGFKPPPPLDKFLTMTHDPRSVLKPSRAPPTKLSMCTAVICKTLTEKNDVL